MSLYFFFFFFGGEGCFAGLCQDLFETVVIRCTKMTSILQIKKKKFLIMHFFLKICIMYLCNMSQMCVMYMFILFFSFSEK